MADKKAKRPTLTSPKGTFKYPRLNEPDFGNEKFPKPDGEFKVKLVMSKADADAFVNAPQKALDGKTLVEMHAEAVKEGAEQFKKLKPEQRKKLGKVTVNELYTPIYGDDEEETGDVEFGFKMKHSGKDKKTGKVWKRRPAVFDAKGTKMNPAPSIWGGTVGKVSFSPGPYFIPGNGMAGLSLNLNAAQVIDLVSNGERSAEGYGFEEEEGYEYSQPETDDSSDEFANEEGGTKTADSQDDGSSDF